MISNRSGRTEGGNGLPADVDSKLLHLVRRIWSDQDFCLDDFQWELSVAASHGVVPLLRERHREYKRKDLAQLNVDVESALRQITDKNKAKTKASAKGTTNIEESEEAEYDRAAAIRDSLEAGTDHHTNSFGGGGLNASLLTCYRQIATTTRIAMPAATTQSDDPHSMPKTNAPSLTTDPMPKANPSNATSATIGINVSRTDTPRAKIVHEGSSSVATAKSTKRRKLRRSEVQQSRGDGNKDFDMMDSNNASASFLLPVSKRPTERYADLGGMGSIVQTIRQLVEYPVTRPELYRHLGVDPPRGVLLRGPPGTYVYFVHVCPAGDEFCRYSILFHISSIIHETMCMWCVCLNRVSHVCRGRDYYQGISISHQKIFAFSIIQRKNAPGECGSWAVGRSFFPCLCARAGFWGIGRF